MTASAPATERADGARSLLLFLSGPNLQLFGRRQPEIYGTATLEDHIDRARAAAGRLDLDLEHLQSDSEADLVAAVHTARGSASAIVINAGALSHYGWALHDALAAFPGPVVELHVSNPHAREAWRRESVIAPVADGTVAGFGSAGYELAVEGAAHLLRAASSPA